jgi:hypothetical protein
MVLVGHRNPGPNLYPAFIVIQIFHAAFSLFLMPQETQPTTISGIIGEIPSFHGKFPIPMREFFVAINGEFGPKRRKAAFAPNTENSVYFARQQRDRLAKPGLIIPVRCWTMMCSR